MITTPLIEGEIQFSFLAGGPVLASTGGSLLASAEVESEYACDDAALSLEWTDRCTPRICWIGLAV